MTINLSLLAVAALIAFSAAPLAAQAADASAGDKVFEFEVPLELVAPGGATPKGETLKGDPDSIQSAIVTDDESYKDIILKWT